MASTVTIFRLMRIEKEAKMEAKETIRKEPRKNNPIKNFCWPLKGKEKEECVQGYEDVFEEDDRKKEKDEPGAG